MREVIEQLKLMANDSGISVLIVGETGTGKELVARSIHYSGPRSDKPFVPINCGALPEQLLESELFGHEKGAFTDARDTKIGLFEVADSGTLFLDEIDSMPVPLQVKLLRALEERTIRRVGGTRDIPLDIRLVCASSRNLEELVEAGEFRSDLFFRVAVATVELPPLRKREGDVVLLASHFASAGNNNSRMSFSNEAVRTMTSYNWPGNVRELENLVQLLSVTHQTGTVEFKDLPEKLKRPAERFDLATESSDLKQATKHMVEKFEKAFIREKLTENRWNVSRTAKMIGLSRASLHSKIKEFGLKEEV